MISPRPFLAHQFSLLHLVGILAVAKTPEDHGGYMARLQELYGDDQPVIQPILVLPQELYLNALCYLTEQIHEVVEPHSHLDDLVDDLARLSGSMHAYRKPVRVEQLDNHPQTGTTSARRPSTRTSPNKSTRGAAATSTSASTSQLAPDALPSDATTASPATRKLRNTPSRASQPADASTSAAKGKGKARSLEREASQLNEHTQTPGVWDYNAQDSAKQAEGIAAARRLADRLRENVVTDMELFKTDRLDGLATAMSDFRVLLCDLADPHSNAYIERTSPLGIWIRRSILNFNQMSRTDAEILIDRMLAFAEPAAVSSPGRTFSSPSGDIYAVTSDVGPLQNTLALRAETISSYLSASTSTDEYHRSLTLLQRFFDFESYPFAGGPQNNRGMRQHALLNLADFHLYHSEFGQARYAATEGLKISKQQGDLIALNALTSLLRRINMEDTGGPGSDPATLLGREDRDGGTALHEVGKEDPGGYVPPMDMVWDVRLGMSTRVPAPALAVDLYRAKALHYHSLTARTSLSSKERRKEKKLLAAQGKDPAVVGVDAQQKKLKWNRLDAPSWLGTSAIMWDTLGNAELAETYRHLGKAMTTSDAVVPASLDVNPNSGARVSILCGQADALARKGAYETALCVLLSELSDLETTRITVRDMQTLQRGIYGVFIQQARRIRAHSVLDHIQAVCPPVTLAAGFPDRRSTKADCDAPTPEQLAGTYPEASTQSGLLGMLELDLQRAQDLLDVSQPAMATPLAVKVVALSSLSDGQALHWLNRAAHVQLARVQTAFGAPDRAVRVLDDVWPDILSGTEADPELAAQARRVRAECLLACVDQASVEKLDHLQHEVEGAVAEAVILLQEAVRGYERVGCPSERVRCLAALAKAQHRAGDTAARDQMATEWRQASDTLSAQLDAAEHALMERLTKVEAICATVSGRLAALRSRV